MDSYPYVLNTRVLHGAVNALLACDVKPAAVLKRIGLPPPVVLTPDAWIPNRLALALLAEAIRATGNPFYGLHAGEQYRFDRIGALGKRILQAQTLREALEAFIRNLGFCHADLAARLDEEGRRARLVVELLGHGPDDARPYDEHVAVCLQKILALTVEEMPFTVYLRHSRPRRTSELERVLGPSLRFKAQDTALVFDRELLDLPLKDTPDEALSRWPVDKWPSADPVARAVMNTISNSIEDESPSVQGIASALGLQVRTLQRHLYQWGTTFESLLDEFRRERGLTLLQSGTCTMAEIAFRLGYSDTAHFTRAFRRWTGLPPRDYVARIRASGRPGTGH